MCHEPPRLFELTYLDTQAFNLFFHFHVLSRGELPRKCVHLFSDQIVDGFPDAFGELVVDLLDLPQAPDRGSDENGIVESTIPAECAALETSALL